MENAAPVSPANKPQISLVSGSKPPSTGDYVTSLLVETLQYLGEHKRGPTESAADNQVTADTREHGQISTSEEWDGEVVEEVFEGGVLKYRVAWEPTLEPGENLSEEMKKVWEDKKAKSVFNNKHTGTDGGFRPKTKKGGIQKRPGRPRKIQPDIEWS